MPAAVSARWNRWRGARRSRHGSTDASVFGAARAEIPVVEDDGAKLKFNPFANVSREEIEAIYKAPNCRRIRWSPRATFRSVHAVFEPDGAGEDARAGRWRGRAKTGMRIHTTKTS